MKVLTIIRHGTQLVAEVSLLAAGRDWLESFSLPERVGILVGIGVVFGTAHCLFPGPSRADRRLTPKTPALPGPVNANSPPSPAVRLELSTEAVVMLAELLKGKRK